MKKIVKVNKTKSTKSTAVKIGVGLAAAAVAGYYFYASKGAKKHRKIAAKWATNMKNEVIKEAKLLENMSPKAFATIVDRVAKTYQKAKSINSEDVKRAATELKANWNTIQQKTKRKLHKHV